MVAPIIKQGGFNTGRLYGTQGQRVYWWANDDGEVTFYDLDRMIVGLLHKPELPELVKPKWVMQEYDAGRYHMACQPGWVPADFDFGDALRL